MNTYRKGCSLLLVFLCVNAGFVNAQTNSSGPASVTPDSQTADRPLIIPEGQPQIAFRFLKDYVDTQLEKDKETNRIDGWIGLVVGGLCVVGGLTELGIAGSLAGVDADAMVQAGSATVLSGLAVAPLGGRLLFLSSDRYKEYQLVASENDLVVREAMAAATLKEFADEGRNRRSSSAFLSIAASVLITGLSAGLEVASGNPWYTGFSKNPAIPVLAAGFLLGGCYGLLTTTPDEQRYEKYVAAHNAVYSLPGQGQ